MKNSRKGNFALMTAIFTPVVLLSASFALDIANLTSLKTRLQVASDSVSLTIVTRIKNGDLNVVDAEAYGRKLLIAQMQDDKKRFSNMVIKPTVTVSESVEDEGTTWKATVGGVATQDTTPIASIFNKHSMSVATNSTAIAGIHDVQTSISLGLVVDVSSSMGLTIGGNPFFPNIGGERRIDALKRASNALFRQLNKSDDKGIYIRTAATAYSRVQQGKSIFRWGTSQTARYISRLTPITGTSSTVAFSWMHKEINKSKETRRHMSKTGQTPQRIILFMTDGNNINPADDGKTQNYCNQAKKDGIRIISVAFGARGRGARLLRRCASSNKDYYSASSASQLVKAFEEIGQSTATSLTRLTN